MPLYVPNVRTMHNPSYQLTFARKSSNTSSEELPPILQVPVNDDHVQFAKEAVADAQKAKQKDGRAIRSLLKAKAPAPGLARPPRLPPGSGGNAVFVVQIQRIDPELAAHDLQSVTQAMLRAGCSI